MFVNTSQRGRQCFAIRWEYCATLKYNVMWQWKTKFVISFSYVSRLLSLYVFVLVSLPVNPRMRRRLIWERRLIYFSVNDGISSPWRTSPLSGNVQANEVGGRDASAKKKSRTSSTWKHHIGSVHMKCYLNTVYQLRIRGRNEGVKWEEGLITFTGPLTEVGLLKRGLFEDLRYTFDTFNYSIFLSKLDL